MTNIINKNYITAFVIGLAILLVAPIAFAGSNPIVETLGATDVTEHSATLNLYFDSRDASYELWDHMPVVTIEYGESSDLDRFTNSRSLTVGTHREAFYLKNLESDETYYYRAIMYYNGDEIRGEKRTFKTLEGKNSNLDNDPIQVVGPTTVPADEIFGFSNGGGGNSTTTTTTTTTGNGSGSVAGASTDAVSGGGNDRLFLSIDDDEEQTAQGEVVTYVIKYENISDIELENATLIVDVPEEMRVISTSGAKTGVDGDDITANLKDLKPGESDTIKITGRIVKRSADEKVIARADVIYGVGNARNIETATDFDVNEYNGLVGGTLGATAFGAGFFPTTIFGWMLVLLIILLLIYGSRRFYFQREFNEAHFEEDNNVAAVSPEYSN